MKVELSKPFEKDLKRLSHEIQIEIAKTIRKIENSENLTDFDVKKLKGYKNNFRIRVGGYRIGFFVENDTLVLARVAKRDEIYKIFP